MDVVEVKPQDALEAVRRRPLERRPVYVHEGVIARLETCERKKDYIRGSGLQYVLHSFNKHCSQLSPDKLLEALRILSENQLFDRRTLYNLYDSIARNILYFTSAQHRKLLKYIGTCLSYTVHGAKLLSADDCAKVISQLDSFLPQSASYSTDDFVENVSNNVESHESAQTVTDDAVIAFDDVVGIGLDTLSIADFDGGPVPLDELNRLNLEIVRKTAALYGKNMLGGTRVVTASDSRAILCSALEIMLKLSSTLDVHSATVQECTRSLADVLRHVNVESLQIWGDAGDAALRDLLRNAHGIADALSIMLLDVFPKIIHAIPLQKSGVSDYVTASMFLKLDLLRSAREVRSTYVSADPTLFHMICDAFHHLSARCAKDCIQMLSLDIQQSVWEMRQLESQLRRLCESLTSQNLNCFSDIISHGQLKRLDNDAASSGPSYPWQGFTLKFAEECVNNIDSMDPSSVSMILCIIADNYGSPPEQAGDELRNLLPECFRKLYANSKSLTTASILDVIERCCTKLGYLHHYAARIMLNTALSRYVTSHADAVLATNLHMLCLRIPYDMATCIRRKSFMRVVSYMDEVCLCENGFRLIDREAHSVEGDGNAVTTRHSPEVATRPVVSPHYNSPGTRFLSDRSAGRTRCVYSSYRKSYGKPKPPSHLGKDNQVMPRQRGASHIHKLWKSIKPDLLRKLLPLIR
ncbi:non-ribosomal peptide synthetase, putative [Babesia ovata]|uniref:Non-ribosomal peptide synthetase, putative n=1 Tax=Babesia ovata TaxID=189622 RepID=A0A2H6K6T1_9APIC|nr:non-ribosomal peptide synthetase, putative [Babesia ovata]GBE58690.1 non-ribosomal peptide synthetase, putative [Babesia ovata]